MTHCCSTQKPSLADPDVVLELLRQVCPVDSESVKRAQSHGRVLAQDICTDRQSPPLDVSAMDGFALCLADLPENTTLTISGDAAIGQPPEILPAGCAMRIFTGAPVPIGADTIIQREWTQTNGNQVHLTQRPKLGDHIRKAGENAPANAVVIQAGQAILPQHASALAAFGYGDITCYKKLTISIITTGDELRAAEDNVEPWQIRDSNSATLEALLGNVAWIDKVHILRCPDNMAQTQQVLKNALEQSDALLTTGGVSMGEHDYVPGALKAIGANIVFHKLAIRPGKPLLGAISADGKPIFALPGNPVSVAITARRFAVPALRRRAGMRNIIDNLPIMQVEGGVSGWTTMPLWVHRPATYTDIGHVRILPQKGSGDLFTMAQSDGFVITPPNVPAAGKMPFMPWTI